MAKGTNGSLLRKGSYTKSGGVGRLPGAVGRGGKPSGVLHGLAKKQ